MIATIPAAAPRDFATVPNLCFNAGSTTFQFSPSPSAPDYRVKFVAAETKPHMRVQLVDEVTNADFALVDDIEPLPGSACRSESAPADLRISLSPHEAEYNLFVHSARFGHEDAAALFAAILHFQDAPDPSEHD